MVARTNCTTLGAFTVRNLNDDSTIYLVTIAPRIAYGTP